LSSAIITQPRFQIESRLLSIHIINYLTPFLTLSASSSVALVELFVDSRIILIRNSSKDKCSTWVFVDRNFDRKLQTVHIPDLTGAAMKNATIRILAGIIFLLNKP
jgi:hypothetical protein